MSSVKHYETTRYGNDCLIKEHWYCVVYPTLAAIRLVKVDGGYYNSELETSTFTALDPCMPEMVREHFTQSGE